MMAKLEHNKAHMKRQNEILDQNESTLDELQDALLPMSQDAINEQAIDDQDKQVLNEVMEQNLVLKVLEKELSQQEEISQKIFDTLNSKVYRPVGNRHTIVTQNARPRLPSARRVIPNINIENESHNVSAYIKAGGTLPSEQNPSVTKFPSIKRVMSKNGLQETNTSQYETFAKKGARQQEAKVNKLEQLKFHRQKYGTVQPGMKRKTNVYEGSIEDNEDIRGDGSLPIIKLKKSPQQAKLKREFSNKGLNTVEKNRARSVLKGK